MEKKSILMEVCVDSIDSILAANNGGAHRIELCSALDVGGLTPNLGLLLCAKELCPHLSIYAMIRPRAGDFHYNQNEITLMKKDIEIMKKYADGFVFGMLLTDGSVDTQNCKTLIDAASPLKCTFHRAFDVSSDPIKSLETIISLGFERILTCGHSKNAEAGVKTLSNLVKVANNRIIIMPGVGINPSNVKYILKETKATEFHASASATRLSEMTFINAAISMGDATANNEYQWKVCDAQKVKDMITIANDIDHDE